jgi:nicotinamidase/pyrazinamidase
MNGTTGEQRIAATLRPTPLLIDVQTEPLEKLWSFLEGCYDSVVFKKNNFDVFSNKNLDQFLSLRPPHVFVVFGVATDFCVKYAVEGLLHRNSKVIVVKDAVFAIDQEAEKQLFDQWENKGVKLLETKEVMNLDPDEFEQLFS